MHVSELSWKHIDHPSEVVEVGQEVTVEVLDVDMDRERVSLSLKATQEDPWQQFARTHQIGQIVPGKVTKLVPFGAFVRVDEGIEGLVHISELAERHVEIPEQVVQVDDDILVKIIDIDLERRRISLSLKQANEGTIGEADGERLRPDALRHGRDVRRAGQLHLPRGLRPRDGRVARGLRRAARGVGAASTPRRTPAGRRTRSRSRRPRKAEVEAGRGAGDVLLRRPRTDEPRPARPTGGSLASDEALQRCARSSPASPEPLGRRTPTTTRAPPPRGDGASLVRSYVAGERASGSAGGEVRRVVPHGHPGRLRRWPRCCS